MKIGMNLKRLVEDKGIQPVAAMVCDMIRKRKFTPEEKASLSVRNIWESFIGPVDDTLTYGKVRQGFIDMKEVKEADVRSTAFSNITGVLLADMVIEGYESVKGIGDQLTRLYQSTQKDERVPGFSAAENVETVNEGEPYSEAGLFDKYVTTGTPLKKGRVISITEEAIYFDQTGMLLDRAFMLGERAALAKEKAILQAVLGLVNSYFPSGTASTLYSAAPYVVASNALADWTNVETAEVSGLAEMTDEEGEAILVVANTLLVPTALKRTAERIMNATEVADGDWGDTGVKTYSRNPVGGQYKVLSSPLVHKLQTTNPTTNWWFGDFQRQFRWKQIWPLQTFRAPANHPDKFDRDIVDKFKVRFYGCAFAMDNKYVVKNTA